MIMKKRFFLFVCILGLLSPLYAQEPTVNVEDSLSKYTELFAKYLKGRDNQKAIYYGSILKDIWDRENFQKEATYCLVTEALSQLYYSTNEIDKSLNLLIELKPVKKALYGENSSNYAGFLHQLAFFHSSLGKYSDAIRLDTETAEIMKKMVGTEHPDYATSLNNLSSHYYNIGNYSEAIRLGTEAMEIREKTLGKEHPEYATSLNNLAIYYSDFGNYSEAVRLGTEALEILKKTIGIEHPNYATSLGSLAIYYSHLGKYSDAIRLSSEAMEIRKKVLGKEHPDYATSLTSLAVYYSKLGNHSKAIRLSTEATEINKKVVGTEHQNYATSLSNLTSHYYNLGNYSEAIRLGTEVTEIWKKVVGTEHPYYAGSLSNLALYYFSLGNYPEAIRLGTEALEIRKKMLGTEHPDYATSLTSLAVYFSSLGNHSEAVRLNTEALKINKKVLGTEHLEYAASLNNLASNYYYLGNYSEAIRLGSEALEIRKKVLGKEHPKYAASLTSLTSIYSSSGNYSEAIRLGAEALEIRKKVLGIEHPDYAESLINFALCYLNIGDYDKAYQHFKQGVDISQKNILSIFSELSSSLQESLWTSNNAYLFNMFFPSIVLKHQTNESVTALYDKSALFAKGILLNTDIAMRKLILESEDPALLAKYDDLVANKSIYEQQLEKPIKEQSLNMDSLRAVIQRQEMELARDSKAYGDCMRNMRINWKDVQKQLDNDDIAIEFMDIPLLRTDSIMYVALTIRKGYKQPKLIPLFEKKQLKTIPGNSYYTQTKLYELIWKPLEGEFSEVKDVYFSPSGELHRIGIEYIPMSQTENICDRYNMHRMSSTRQLAVTQDEKRGENSVLYGGLRYEENLTETTSKNKHADESFPFHANVDSLSLRGSYEYLLGTKEETDEIAADLERHARPYSYYSDTKGTEESFKQLDGTKPKMLHIATHGFYMTQQDAELERISRPIQPDNHPTHYEDKPMTRSGLLLAGCNPALNHKVIPKDKEDGILTAQEISKLDLRGLELVVLSACQTGLGDITSGEGVFGLQRGFKKAGAKTIIMSLWKVKDSATRQLMISFYNHYLNGMTKEQAFRKAQEELRQQSTSSQNKPDWAAFVMLDGIN